MSILFLDENNGFVFTTSVYVKTPELPIPGGQRETKAEYWYADTYLNHLNSEVALLATKYRFHIANDEERKALISAKLCVQMVIVQHLCLMKGILYFLIKHLMVLV